MDQKAETIEFSGEDDKGTYGFLSNRFISPFEIDGKIWQSVEHYFQAQKFAGTEHEEAVRNAKNVEAAHKMGRDRSRPLRKDWDEVKEKIAYEGILAKFTQNEELKTKLMETGQNVLVQKTRNDNYWGVAKDGKGENKMGEIIQSVRTSLL